MLVISPLLALLLLALAACGTNGAGSSGTDRSAAGSGSENVAPRPPAEPLPASTKGYELYAWDDAGEVRFTLITGTNRPKTAAELTVRETTVEDGEWVTVNRSGLSNLAALLGRVPAGTPVVLTQHTELPSLSGPNRERIQQALDDAGF